MSPVAKILPHYTYADWESWEGKWELIEGIPYAMTPMASPDHQIAASNILIEFGIALKACKDCRAIEPLDYKIAEDTIVQPDMLIVCNEIRKKYLDFPPLLVLEVLSPATALKDRNNKFFFYEQAGIRYYIIADAEIKLIEIYELINGTYQLVQKGNDLTYAFHLGSCVAAIDFKEIW